MFVCPYLTGERTRRVESFAPPPLLDLTELGHMYIFAYACVYVYVCIYITRAGLCVDLCIHGNYTLPRVNDSLNFPRNVL